LIYILTALKSEAQAVVDRYKLTRDKKNDELSLFISGVGAQNMFTKAKMVRELMSDDDIIVNIGICGASKEYKIGQLVDGFKENLTCVDCEVSQDEGYTLVDMESSGFLEATEGLQKRYIFKVVSDHFEPERVTKEGTKALIFNHIDEIMQRVKL